MIGVKVNKHKLEDVRTELLLTQRELAARAGVAVSVVANCENGRAIRKLSAQAVLKAINQERNQQGMSRLAFDDIAWKLQGE